MSTDSDTSILHRVARTATDRRTFLAGTGAAGVALVVAGCGSSPTTANSPVPTGFSSSATPSSGGDAAVAKTAASLEVLAVATYKAAGAAATGGHLGAVPPAVVTFVTTAAAHHQAALDKWNAVLARAARPPSRPHPPTSTPPSRRSSGW